MEKKKSGAYSPEDTVAEAATFVKVNTHAKPDQTPLLTVTLN